MLLDCRQRAFPSAIYIGSVLTPGDRAQALQIMDNISNKLTIVIANIKCTQNSLTQANSIVINEVV